MSLPQSGVSRDDVVWCFQHILGRVLTDENAISHFVKSETDFRSLITTLSSSHEFQQMFALARRRGVDLDGFVYDDRLSSQQRVLTTLRKLRPQAADGYQKVRIGTFGDGGYVMLNDFEGVEAAYSLGIKDDVAWDRDVAARGIDIYQYDHTIDALPEQNDRFHWSKIGIAKEPGGNLDTLPNLIKSNGHAESSDLILKCDIEGHEWDMLCGMTAEQLGQFRQIVIETHNWAELPTIEFGGLVERAISNLTVYHRLVHVHANNHAAYAIAGGIPIPAVLELTFVHAARYAMRDSDEIFPTSLDVPCHPDRADLWLGSFRF